MDSGRGCIDESRACDRNLVEMKTAGLMTENMQDVDAEAPDPSNAYVVGFTPINQRYPLQDLSTNWTFLQTRPVLGNNGKADIKPSSGQKRVCTRDSEAIVTTKKPRKPSESAKAVRCKGQNLSDNTRPISSVFPLSKLHAASAVCPGKPTNLLNPHHLASASQFVRQAVGTHEDGLAALYRAPFSDSDTVLPNSNSETSTLGIPETPPRVYSEDDDYCRDTSTDVRFVPPNSAQVAQPDADFNFSDFSFDKADLNEQPSDIEKARSSTAEIAEIYENDTKLSSYVKGGHSVAVSDAYDEFTDDFGDSVELSDGKKSDEPVHAVVGRHEPDRCPPIQTNSVSPQFVPEKPGLTFLPPKLYIPAKTKPGCSKSSGTLTELEWASVKIPKAASKRTSQIDTASSENITVRADRSPECQARKAPDYPTAKVAMAPPAHVISFDVQGHAIPFARPPFPPLLNARSPIPGLTANTCLRTCFRIGGALNAFSATSRSNSLAVIELYAHVLSSQRAGYKQFFRLGDLFTPGRPPFLNGVFGLWRTNRLWDADSKPLLTAKGEVRGTLKMCRAVGHLKRNEKMEVEMSILSIWQCTWEDVEVAKGVVCA